MAKDSCRDGFRLNSDTKNEQTYVIGSNLIA